MAEVNPDRSVTAKSAAEIERDIDRTRGAIDDTLDRIFTKLTPGRLFEQAFDHIRTSRGLSSFGLAVRDNPVPVVLAAFGIGWIVIAGLRNRTRPKQTLVRSSPPGYIDRVAPAARLADPVLPHASERLESRTDHTSQMPGVQNPNN